MPRSFTADPSTELALTLSHKISGPVALTHRTNELMSLIQRNNVWHWRKIAQRLPSKHLKRLEADHGRLGFPSASHTGQTPIGEHGAGQFG